MSDTCCVQPADCNDASCELKREYDEWGECWNRMTPRQKREDRRAVGEYIAEAEREDD